MNKTSLPHTVPKHLILVSHLLCPYVQRASIVLAEKGIAFDRVDIDLANKPDWFLKISPLGKTPVLLVDGQPIFESAAICEYLEETTVGALHPRDPLARAQHRGWMEFGSAVLNTIAGFYAATDEQQLGAKAAEIAAKFRQVEDALAAGPFFAGQHFSMVDAVFSPVFRYFDAFETLGDFGFFASTPKVRAWRSALVVRPSVRGAVCADYPDLLRKFLLARRSALSRRMAGAAHTALT